MPRFSMPLWFKNEHMLARTVTSLLFLASLFRQPFVPSSTLPWMVIFCMKWHASLVGMLARVFLETSKTFP